MWTIYWLLDFPLLNLSALFLIGNIISNVYSNQFNIIKLQYEYIPKLYQVRNRLESQNLVVNVITKNSGVKKKRCLRHYFTDLIKNTWQQFATLLVMSDKERWIFITRYEDLNFISGQRATCSSVSRAALSAQLTVIVTLRRNTCLRIV